MLKKINNNNSTNKDLQIIGGFWNKLFKEQYPDIEFIEPGSGFTVSSEVPSYEIGWFYDDPKNPNDVKFSLEALSKCMLSQKMRKNGLCALDDTGNYSELFFRKKSSCPAP